MAGNQRVNRPKKKKGPTVGSGGQNRRRLEGKGPTPKAEDRTYHPAYKRKKAAEAAAAASAAREAARTKLRGVLHLEEGHELIAGRNPVVEAVRSGIPLTRVFMVGSAISDERVGEVVRTATALGAPLIEVSRTELDKMTDEAVHQGVAIEVPPYDYCDVEDLVERGERHERPGLIVALDSVTDPHNLGAAIRSSSAFGVDGVVIPERRSASVNVTAWKVSAGAVARVPVARVTNLVRTLEKLKSQGYFVVGLDGGGDVSIDELKIADVPLVVVTGAEGSGLARLTRETCDMIASIPISAELESLNASVATGIALYQIDRLRAAALAAE
ncbi:23S rRNA (guanosine(2251)-2'-O)-methyltransferase RlmB [Arcanobacterium haemolyticum]|nr:23S rRNA (guanosine(2251)-2'-O)-methyltransferase RlmB [Arcanobacterium haemolyticum]